MLRGEVTSAAKTWQFGVPATVTSFSFQVQVSARIPQVGGVLRYRQDGAGLNGVSCVSASFCFAVGDVGTIRSWNGRDLDVDRHRNQSGSPRRPRGVHQLCHGGGRRWEGCCAGTASTGKRPARPASPVALRASGAPAPPTALPSATGATTLRWNGATDTWTAAGIGVGSTEDLHAVWGTAGNNVYAAGNQGLLARWNGTSWSTINLSTSSQLPWSSGAPAPRTSTWSGRPPTVAPASSTGVPESQ